MLDGNGWVEARAALSACAPGLPAATDVHGEWWVAEGRSTRGQASSGPSMPTSAGAHGRHDFRDLLSSTRRQALCRQESGTSVASSESSALAPDLSNSPLRSHASSPPRRSTAYPLRRLSERPVDPSPPSSPPSPPAPSPGRRRNPAVPSPARAPPAPLQPSPSRTTRTSTLGREGTQRERAPVDRPNGPLPSSTTTSPLRPRGAADNGEGERRGRKRARAGQGEWAEEDGEGKEQGPRDAPAHDDITTSPTRPRTRPLGTARGKGKALSTLR